MPSERMPRPAYVVDVDENGKQVRGTVRSALKEKPKISQRDSRSGRTKKPHSDSGDQNSGYSQAVELVTERERDTKLERRKSIAQNPKSPRKSTRPPLAHENTSRQLSIPHRSRDNPSNYGIAPPSSYASSGTSTHGPMAIPLRPRAVTTQTYPRPLSYHQPYTTNQGPPLSMSAYYQHQPIVAPSYPPPSSASSFMRYAASPNTPQVDYFAQHISQPPPRPLAARFDVIARTQAMDPITRTASAFGTRDTRRQSMDGQYEEGYYEDSYASRVSDPAARIRESIRGPPMRLQQDLDTIAMPPPPQPQPRPILRKPVTEYLPEPYDDQSEYSERYEPPERYERPQYRELSRPRRPSTTRNSVSYDLGQGSERVRVETANNGRRRQSYYGQSTTVGSGASSAYEDKVSKAANYQEEVAGPSVPLTADLLKKQQRRQGGSSRSTKSSGSRDESDYKHSATTRTTRSGSGNDDENVTIKVTGQARVMVGGAQIDCNEGGEISISRQKSMQNGTVRGSEYGGQRQIDDRRSRVDRPIGRSRISSTHSYTRSTPKYQMDDFL